MADCMDDISKALACCAIVSFLSDAEIQKHASANFSTSTAPGSPFIPEFGSSIRNPQAEFNKRTIHKGDCDFVRARARRNRLLHMDSSRICYLLLLAFFRASGVHASPLILCSFWVQRSRWEEKTSLAFRTGQVSQDLLVMLVIILVPDHNHNHDHDHALCCKFQTIHSFSFSRIADVDDQRCSPSPLR